MSNFKAIVNSKNEEMSAHRNLWKVFVANIVFAFTGIGALPVIGSLIFTGHGLFHKTKTQQKVDDIANNAKKLGFFKQNVDQIGYELEQQPLEARM